MSNYTKNVTAYTTSRELPDLWSPFALNKFGYDNVFITPLDSLDMPYSGMCYTENGSHVTEYDNSDWTAVSGLNARSSDIQAPNETMEGHTLLGLEPGIYQCVIVEMLHCNDCEDLEDCDCDTAAGWTLLKLDDGE